MGFDVSEPCVTFPEGNTNSPSPNLIHDLAVLFSRVRSAVSGLDGALAAGEQEGGRVDESQRERVLQELSNTVCGCHSSLWSRHCYSIEKSPWDRQASGSCYSLD